MEAVEDPPSTVHWKQGVLNTLQSLPSTSPPDCCIIVGTASILTHKTALQLNSALLTSGDVGFNKQSGLIEIDLLPEFSECFNLVSDIVNSFYTGNLKVGEEDLNIVYKFAKCYSVQWIMDFLKPMFVDYVRKDESCERFIEVMKFAESIWCTDLSNACCELLNLEIINKISQPEVLSQMDVFMMKSITSYEKLATPEKEIFGLVVNWINAKPSCAAPDLSSILENIQYHLIESDYLFDVVFDFVLNQENVADSTRRSILMRVKGSMKQSSEHNFRSTRFMEKISSYKDVLNPSVKPFSSSNDECLRKIDLLVQGKTRQGGKYIEISEKEVSSVIYDKFEFMAESDKNTFAMYLSTNTDMALKFIDQLLLLHNTFPSQLLIRLVLSLCLYSAGQNYQRLYQIPWNLVSYQTVSLMVTTSSILEELSEFDCKNEFKKNSRSYILDFYSKYSERFEGCGQIELIMLWALANPTQENQIKELLKSVCFRKIPSEYLALILLPCLRTIFPSMTELKCAHAHKENDVLPSLMKMRVERMPNAAYQLNSCTHNFNGDLKNVYYEFEFRPENNACCLELISHNMDTEGVNSRGKSHSYILFDENTPRLPIYPLFIRSSNLSTVKSFLKCFTNFRFMFYKRLS